MTESLIFISGALAGVAAFWVGDMLANVARPHIRKEGEQ